MISLIPSASPRTLVPLDRSRERILDTSPFHEVHRFHKLYHMLLAFYTSFSLLKFLFPYPRKPAFIYYQWMLPSQYFSEQVAICHSFSARASIYSLFSSFARHSDGMASMPRYAPEIAPAMAAIVSVSPPRLIA